MADQRIVQWIAHKYHGLSPELSERARRRWAAVEAISLGRGGITAVSAATGLAHSTIRRGIAEMGHGGRPGPPGRVGAAGGARQPRRPPIAAALDLQEHAPVGPGTDGARAPGG